MLALSRAARFRRRFLASLAREGEAAAGLDPAAHATLSAALAEGGRFTGPTERFMGSLCADVLAAYRMLAPRIGEAAAYQAVRRAYARVDFNPVWPVRMALAVIRNPFPLMARASFAAMIESKLGRFLTAEDHKSADVLEGRVTACGFADFFREKGEAALVTVFCGADHGWMDAMNGSPAKLRIERTETISTGGAVCRFRFVHAPEKTGPAPRVDVVPDGPLPG